MEKSGKTNIADNVSLVFLFICLVLGQLSACNANDVPQDKGNSTMKVKVISLEKCSATPATISLVENVARQMGKTISLEHIVVKTAEDAVAHRHIGSPTVQINGLDIEPEAREIKQFGVT